MQMWPEVETLWLLLPIPRLPGTTFNWLDSAGSRGNIGAWKTVGRVTPHPYSAEQSREDEECISGKTGPELAHQGFKGSGTNLMLIIVEYLNIKMKL